MAVDTNQETGLVKHRGKIKHFIAGVFLWQSNETPEIEEKKTVFN